MPPKRKPPATANQKGTKRQNVTKKGTTTTTKKRSAATKERESTTFTVTRCENWYTSYVDANDPNGDITPEGAQRFFEDIGISLESVDPILIGWKMNANRMGYFTKEEWMATMTKLQVDSPERFKQQMHVWEKEIEDDKAFKRFYQYTFDFAKTVGQKSMDVDVAVALWTLLLGDNCNHVASFVEFIQTMKPTRFINKDQWLSFLDFTRIVPNDLQGYDSTSSWPVLFDDYANWRLNRSEH